MVSISRSAASLGLNKTEGRVIGLLGTSVSVFTWAFRALSCAAMEAAAIFTQNTLSFTLSTFLVDWRMLIVELCGHWKGLRKGAVENGGEARVYACVQALYRKEFFFFSWLICPNFFYFIFFFKDLPYKWAISFNITLKSNNFQNTSLSSLFLSISYTSS